MELFTYPKLTLDGVEYTIKVTIAGIRRCKEAGVDVASSLTGDLATMGHNVAVQVAAFAHTQVDGKLCHASLSVDAIEEDMEIVDIHEYFAVIKEAAEKRLPAETPPSLSAAA